MVLYCFNVMKADKLAYKFQYDFGRVSTNFNTTKVNSNETNLDFNTRVKRLYFSDIVRQRLLNRVDVRSIRKWCEDNSVKIYKDSTGEYAMQQEFDLAYDAPIIQNLKLKHSQDWQIVYKHYLNGELYNLVDIKPKVEPKSPKYLPKGSISKLMMSKN